MKTPIFHFFLSLCLIFFGQSLQAQELQQLEPNIPIERKIVGGESQTYLINLKAGQFFHINAEQKAIDVTLILKSSEGVNLNEINLTRAGGLERFSGETLISGDYQLSVSANGSNKLVGSYQLQLETKLSATEQDKQRITAEKLLLEANELRKQGGKTAEQSIEKLQSALSFWQQIDDKYWIAWSLYNIGIANSYLNRHEKAIEFYEQALIFQREIKDRSGEGSTLNSLGITYASVSSYEKAIEYYEQALAIHREVKNLSEEGNTLINLGSAFYSLSRYEKSLEYRQQALAVHREVGNRNGEASALNALGSTYSSLSRYEKAIEHYEQALAIHRENKNRVGEGIVFNNLGRVYNSLSRYEKAIEYLEQSLTIYREVKQRANEGIAINSLGNAYFALNQHEKAIECYKQSLIIAREVKNRFGEGNALDNLSKVYSGLKNNEKAIEFLEQALTIYREINNQSGEGNALNNLGHIYFGLSKYEKALEFYQQALAIARQVKIRYREADVLYSLAKTNLAQDNILSAQTNIEESLKITESLRSDILSFESRASYLAAVQNSYQLYTDLLMRQHKTDPTKGFDALAVENSERQRVRSLLDLLTENKTEMNQEVDSALIKRESEITKQLSDKAQTLVQTTKTNEVAALKREISQLENDLERVKTAIRKANPQFAELTQTQPLKLKEIQSQLDADTLLLEYSLGEKRSYLWVIAKDSLTSYELPKEEEIKENALQVYNLLTARNTKINGETIFQRKSRIINAEAKLPLAAKNLSDILLRPAATQFGDKRLVIVADGALQYIPFAMLPDPVISAKSPIVGKNQASISNLQPLIINHEVISLPSASALAIQRTELANRQLAPKTLAVIADPVFDKTDVRFKTAFKKTNFNLQPPSDAVSANIRGLEYIADTNSNGKLVIRRLPFTEQEATGLLAMAPKASSFEATGFQANRETVLSGKLSQYRYIHFATHGLLDTERPGLSALVLSMVDSKGKAENGFLRANDIYNMKLPAELVVLSACQTGLGKEVKGEGLIGLTRSFMYAGARRVVVSLWSVNDKATADLMENFYQGMLKNNERPAAALRNAQIEMWKQKAWQSPYYWSAFIIQGDWR